MTLSPRQARTCIVVNQLACPGIGTIMAGRRISGFLQAVMAIAGFCAVMAWGLMYLNAVYKFALDASATEASWKAMKPPAWIGIAGLAFAIVSWLWALFSSFQILNESRRHQPV